MRTSSLKLLGICLLLLAAVSGIRASQARALEVAIDISPNVLNLESQGTVVTVHTDLDYEQVDAYSVYLNDVAISSWKADNRGDFVAKFSMEEVKSLDGLVIDEYNTLQIAGVTTDGEAFAGAQDILVIDKIPRGQ
ncbi:MAG: hypothetical protein AB1640_13525 [bacterium]